MLHPGLPPLCSNCAERTRLMPSVFGLLFHVEIFECDLCGLVATEPAIFSRRPRHESRAKHHHKARPER